MTISGSILEVVYVFGDVAIFNNQFFATRMYAMP